MSTIASVVGARQGSTLSRVGSVVCFMIGGAALIAVLAQVAIPLPFTPVPITGQTLGVLLVAAAGGPALGVSTVVLYLALAVVGLPVLAPDENGSHSVGPSTLGLAAATGGYLWGFVAASAVVGWLARRGWDRSWRSAIGAMLLGSIVIYAIGVPWLVVAIDVPLQKGLELGLYPFVIGDTLKLFAAAALLPVAWWLIGSEERRSTRL